MLQLSRQYKFCGRSRHVQLVQSRIRQHRQHKCRGSYYMRGLCKRKPQIQQQNRRICVRRCTGVWTWIRIRGVTHGDARHDLRRRLCRMWGRNFFKRNRLFFVQIIQRRMCSGPDLRKRVANCTKWPCMYTGHWMLQGRGTFRLLCGRRVPIGSSDNKSKSQM